VVGRSNIVGLPAALLLQNRDATVTMVHSRTPDAQKIAAGTWACWLPGLINRGCNTAARTPALPVTALEQHCSMMADNSCETQSTIHDLWFALKPSSLHHLPALPPSSHRG
jgi:hypothetical protein